MATDVTDRKSALDFLYSRINYERLAHVPYNLEAFKLDRMRQLLARMGDPHLALKGVHIAGTKGKGSTDADEGTGVVPTCGSREGFMARLCI